MTKSNKRMVWRKDYGDGYETEDLVLWVDGKPTDTIINEYSEECYILDVDGEEIGLYDTKADAKRDALEILKKRSN
jgi:SH3-like domain-containing protein